MARKQTSRRLNRFLDLIGLVDSERDEAEQEAPVRSTRTSAPRRSDADDFGDFDDFDTPARTRRTPSAQEQTGRRSSRVNLESDDEFGESQGWTNASPGYSPRPVRTRSAAGTSVRSSQTGTRPSSGSAGYRSAGYRSAASYGERRPAASPGYRASEYQSRYRSAASGTGYGASARREAADAFESAPSAATAAAPAYHRHQTVIFTLHSIDECRDVILALIDKKSVLLSLEDLQSAEAQRALDTMSGASYAIGATLSKASDRTWLITPSNVEVERSSLDADDYSGYHF